MYPWVDRKALLVPFFLNALFADGAIAQSSDTYLGTVTDERVTRCGILVNADDMIRIEPFLEGRKDLQGRVVLDVIKDSAAGKSQSRQASGFANGAAGKILASTGRPSDVTVVLTVTDRSGKALCEMRRSMKFDAAPTKI